MKKLDSSSNYFFRDKYLQHSMKQRIIVCNKDVLDLMMWVYYCSADHEMATWQSVTTLAVTWESITCRQYIYRRDHAWTIMFTFS